MPAGPSVTAVGIHGASSVASVALYYDHGRGLRCGQPITQEIQHIDVLAPGAVEVSPLCILLGSYERSQLRIAPPASVVGREGVFVVTSVGEGVAAGVLGSRVVAESYVACGTCARCTGGIGHLCVKRVNRTAGLGRGGARLHAGTFEIVPASLSIHAASLAQSVGACVHTVRLARAEKNSYITILGDGPAAIITALVAQASNSYVRVLGRNPERFGVLERVGIKHRHSSEAGKRNDQHIVIDCTGDASGDSLKLAAEHVAPRGRIIIKGAIAPHLVTTNASLAGINALVNLEATLIGAGAGTVRDGLAFLMRHPFDTTLVISKRFQVQRTGELTDALLDSRTLLCAAEWPIP